MRLQCRVRNLASHLRPDTRLTVLCRPALIQAAPGAYFQGKGMTLPARRGGEVG